MKKAIVVGIVILIVIVVAYYFISPAFKVVELNDVPPSTTSIKSGTLIKDAHDVSGTVKIIESEGKKILRFENLNTINGPDLYIYLATDTQAKDIIDLGTIKATKGNVNYDIPDNVDLAKYNNVLIWCKSYHVLFSHAQLA